MTKLYDNVRTFVLSEDFVTQSPTTYKLSAIFGSGLPANPPVAAVTIALDTTMLGNGLFLTSTCLHPDFRNQGPPLTLADLLLVWVPFHKDYFVSEFFS